MRVVAVINQKGGVAKTTTCANVASSLAAKGKSALLIDLDPQANLTLGLAGSWSDLPYTLNQVMLDPARMPMAGVVRRVGEAPLFLAPGHMDLARCEPELLQREGGVYNLRQALDALARTFPFEWAFIDCPPSLGALTQTAIVASSHLLIPTEPKLYAFAGMDTLNSLVTDLRARYAFNTELLGVLLTLVDRTTRLTRSMSTVIREQFGDRVFDSVIYRNVRVSEAEVQGSPVVLLDKRSSGAKAYSAVADEIVARVGA